MSLYFLTAALSGERKSAADSVFSNANKQWEDRVRKQRAPAVSTAKSLHYAWSMEKEGLLTQIKRSMITGDNTEYLKLLLSN